LERGFRFGQVFVTSHARNAPLIISL
jgi:hypothetical protein